MNDIDAELINKKNKPFKISDFSDYQLYQIRRGLEEGIDVTAYADSKFDKHQMREIRKGLEEGLYVKAYADPKFNDLLMRKIREDLEHTANQINEEELDESKKIVESNNEIQKVTPEKLNEVIENMKDDKYYGRFYAKEGDIFVAVDNTTANAWTEEFDTEKDALLWLENTDMTREELVDMRKINNNDEEEDER